MRKIVAGLFISLDGVVALPEKWAFTYLNDEVSKGIAAGITQADAVLLGRRTYQQFAKIWPSQGSNVPMARFLNRSPKYVIAQKSDSVGALDLDWEPVTLLTGTLAEESVKLTAQPGKNIQVPGSPQLVRSLLREGILDELSLGICPVVVGQGMRLFDEMADQVTLKLAESKTFSNGLLSVTYQPASA
jgi:dihydrofolate reductase